MLLHRTGTKYEDMYWIDLDSLKVIAKETNTNIPKKIVMVGVILFQLIEI